VPGEYSHSCSSGKHESHAMGAPHCRLGVCRVSFRRSAAVGGGVAPEREAAEEAEEEEAEDAEEEEAEDAEEEEAARAWEAARPAEA
jgi:hypothetical protein